MDASRPLPRSVSSGPPRPKCLRGWLGLILLAASWPLNWLLPGARTAYLFFPLWLGYILAVDALVAWRGHKSLWLRSRKGFVLLFVLSAPAEYYALCTLSFSTVMPAVFETAELVRGFRWINALRPGVIIPDTPRMSCGMFLAGLAMLALTLAWPKYFYPLLWLSLVFILDPLNRRVGRPHFSRWLQRGDWRPVVSLSLGALICGFFWELWNFWSWPRWIYHTPGTDFLHVFAMPLLGYGGYIPFALELFALKNFLWPREPELAL